MDILTFSYMSQPFQGYDHVSVVLSVVCDVTMVVGNDSKPTKKIMCRKSDDDRKNRLDGGQFRVFISIALKVISKFFATNEPVRNETL